MIELINTNTSKERLDELILNITSRLNNISDFWEINTKDMECGEYREYVSFCKELDDTRAFLILYKNIAEELKEQK